MTRGKHVGVTAKGSCIYAFATDQDSKFGGNDVCTLKGSLCHIEEKTERGKCDLQAWAKTYIARQAQFAGDPRD